VQCTCSVYVVVEGKAVQFSRRRRAHDTTLSHEELLMWIVDCRGRMILIECAGWILVEFGLQGGRWVTTSAKVTSDSPPSNGGGVRSCRAARLRFSWRSDPC
jgi:hypothetical protein